MPSKIRKISKDSYYLTVSAGYNGSVQNTYSKTVKANSQKEAEKRYILFEQEVQNNNAIASGKQITLKDFFCLFLKDYAEPNLEANTIEYYKNIFKRVDEALGHIKLQKLSLTHIQKFYRNLREPGVKIVQKKKGDNANSDAKLADITVKKYHTFLVTLLNKAKKWHYISSNPALDIDTPKARKIEKAIPTKEEMAKSLNLLDEAPQKYKVSTILAIECGLRREEIFGLEWQDIDFDKKTINVVRVRVYIPKTGVIEKPPKNDPSRRFFTLPPLVEKELLELKRQQEEFRRKLGAMWHNDNKIIANENGEAMHPCSLGSWLRKFEAKNGTSHATPHTFRHFMTSSHISECHTDPRTVSHLLGHSKVSTTLDVYSHVIPDAEKKAVLQMDNFLQNLKNSI